MNVVDSRATPPCFRRNVHYELGFVGTGEEWLNVGQLDYIFHTEDSD